MWFWSSEGIFFGNVVGLHLMVLKITWKKEQVLWNWAWKSFLQRRVMMLSKEKRQLWTMWAFTSVLFWNALFFVLYWYIYVWEQNQNGWIYVIIAVQGVVINMWFSSQGDSWSPLHSTCIPGVGHYQKEARGRTGKTLCTDVNHVISKMKCLNLVLNWSRLLVLIVDSSSHVCKFWIWVICRYDPFSSFMIWSFYVLGYAYSVFLQWHSCHWRDKRTGTIFVLYNSIQFQIVHTCIF